MYTRAMEMKKKMSLSYRKIPSNNNENREERKKTNIKENQTPSSSSSSNTQKWKFRLRVNNWHKLRPNVLCSVLFLFCFICVNWHKKQILEFEHTQKVFCFLFEKKKKICAFVVLWIRINKVKSRFKLEKWRVNTQTKYYLRLLCACARALV